MKSGGAEAIPIRIPKVNGTRNKKEENTKESGVE
jgi:hypothetical protein